MDEHLAILNLSAAGTYRFAVPKGGRICGVYSSSAVTIAYDDNGTVGTLKSSVTEWEPYGGFTPAAIAYLQFTTSAAAQISIRYEV